MTRWDFSAYAHPAQVVAAALLGQKLVRVVDDYLLSGLIVETEAYGDGDAPDLACHGDRANHGQPTARTAVMFGPAGHAYVYFTYGMHWMFNIVTGQTGQANAVLIRALQPVDGVKWMQQRRGARPLAELTNGPAKLAQALAIDQSLNGANLCDPEGVIWIEMGTAVNPSDICTGPRIGLGQTPEPWLSMPWRYWLKDNPFVSKK
ncbi:MAG: DNA-3-methyladenine glycosylase [Chloroflexi bacterium]|nr:DNA-3-methyladenine glycosylase [Ardenticatenaceae bacterium]MBL1128809.1 DNA-3-methyladenine glycosylase [Chloroflexota bacterium]NOG34887.1 DNA-3-methyladenine glycosylase [Chloroflexota bacterium]